MNLEKPFIELLQANERLVFKVCSFYVKDAEGRKDLYQEIVLQLWKAFPDFKSQSKVSTWMYRIALNTAISHQRKEKIKPAKAYLAELKLDFPVYSESFLNEQICFLYKAIESLGNLEKAIILLYLEDTNYNDIAEIAGISANHVAVKVSRIKEKIRAIMNPLFNK